MFLKLIPFRFRETNSIKISWNFKSLKISTCAKSLFNISMLTERSCSFHKKPRRFSLNCFIFWRNEDFAQKTCSNFVQCCKGWSVEANVVSGAKRIYILIKNFCLKTYMWYQTLYLVWTFLVISAKNYSASLCTEVCLAR